VDHILSIIGSLTAKGDGFQYICSHFMVVTFAPRIE